MDVDLSVIEDLLITSNNLLHNFQEAFSVLIICVCFVSAFLVSTSLIRMWLGD